MYRIYDRGKIIAETNDKAQIDAEVQKYVAAIRKEITPALNRIKRIQELIEDIYPKRAKDTNEEYVEFLRKMNPDFIEAVEALGKEIFSDDFLGIDILAPNSTFTLLVYRTDNGIIDKKSISAIRMELFNRYPTQYTIEVREEK